MTTEGVGKCFCELDQDCCVVASCVHASEMVESVGVAQAHHRFGLYTCWKQAAQVDSQLKESQEIIRLTQAQN